LIHYFNTDRLDDTFQIGVPIDATQLSDENNAIKQKPMRKPKRLSLAAAPKRMPLGQMAQSPQGVSMDVAGE
jgi:abnormal spindle-like microcephaly-associated protein